MYIQGGIKDSSIDFWSLDLKTKEWSSLPNPPFKDVWRHAIVGNGNEILVFGGLTTIKNETQTAPFTEIWSFDLLNARWKWINPKSSFYGSGTATFISDTLEIIVYGGPFDSSLIVLNKKGWALVSLKHQSNRLDIKSAPKYIPGRVGHTSLYDLDGKRLISFGGYIPDQSDSNPSSFFSIYSITNKTFLDLQD